MASSPHAAASHEAASPDARDAEASSPGANSPRADSEAAPQDTCSTPEKQRVGHGGGTPPHHLQSGRPAADAEADAEHGNVEAGAGSEDSDDDIPLMRRCWAASEAETVEARAASEDSDDDIPPRRRSGAAAVRRQSLASPEDERQAARSVSQSPSASSGPTSSHAESAQDACEHLPKDAAAAAAEDLHDGAFRDMTDDAADVPDDNPADSTTPDVHGDEAGAQSSPSKRAGAGGSPSSHSRLQHDAGDPHATPMELVTPRGQSRGPDQEMLQTAGVAGGEITGMSGGVSPEPSRAREGSPGSRGFSLSKPPRSPFAIKAFPSLQHKSCSKVQICLSGRSTSK